MIRGSGSKSKSDGSGATMAEQNAGRKQAETNRLKAALKIA